MASLLERMNIIPNTTATSTGPTRRLRSNRSISRNSTPYSRSRPPKGDIDARWSHDLYETHNSLSARLSSQPGAPKPRINNLAQRALREATTGTSAKDQGGLAIRGASNSSETISDNIIEVSGLVAGTTAADVVAIFKQCGPILSSKLIRDEKARGEEDTKVRIAFKKPGFASEAVNKFHNEKADGKTLSVRFVGSTSKGTTLSSRLGGPDGLGLVRDAGSVDVLMGGGEESGSKMRSDSIIKNDPRAQVMVSPPGSNPADHTHANPSRGGRRGRGRGRGGRRGGGQPGARKMEID